MRAAAALLAASLTLVSCGDAAEAACVELREPQDPGSGQHVLTEGAVVYESNPPTSGPHIAGPTPAGKLTSPVDPAIQVRLLEAGGVMIQYDDSLSPPEIAALEAFGDDLVAIAPAFGELTDRVVVTAWTWKLNCGVVSDDDVREFIAARPADAPGLD